MFFSKDSCEYIRMENLDYENKNIERRYLENMRNYQLLKIKNSLLELEKDFIGLKNTELKDRKEKNKREMGELFHKLIIVSKTMWISLKNKK